MLREYDDIDNIHPAGFIGARVAVSVDRRLRQRYFPFRTRKGDYLPTREIERLRQDAAQLDRRWREEQDRCRRARSIEAEPSTSRGERATGIPGISVGWFLSSKRRITADGRPIRYESLRPLVLVSVRIDGERFIKGFSIFGMGYDRAWQAALHLLRDVRGMKRISPAWNACKPSVAELRKRYRLACRQYPAATAARWTAADLLGGGDRRRR